MTSYSRSSHAASSGKALPMLLVLTRSFRHLSYRCMSTHICKQALTMHRTRHLAQGHLHHTPLHHSRTLPAQALHPNITSRKHKEPYCRRPYKTKSERLKQNN